MKAACMPLCGTGKTHMCTAAAVHTAAAQGAGLCSAAGLRVRLRSTHALCCEHMTLIDAAMHPFIHTCTEGPAARPEGACICGRGGGGRRHTAPHLAAAARPLVLIVVCAHQHHLIQAHAAPCMHMHACMPTPAAFPPGAARTHVQRLHAHTAQCNHRLVQIALSSCEKAPDAPCTGPCMNA